MKRGVFTWTISKPVALEGLDQPTVVEVIKETKIGQGLKFLPRRIGHFKKMLQSLLDELVDTGKSLVRNEFAAVLEELHRQNGISLERYTEMKKYHEIL